MQDGHKVRVRLAVRQPLPRQLKHLGCTFGVNVDLWAGARQGKATAPSTASPQVPAPDPMSHPHPKTDRQTGPTALQGANRAVGQPEDKRLYDRCCKRAGQQERFPASRFYPRALSQSTQVFLKLAVALSASACISRIRTHQLKSFGKLQFIFISKHFEEI